MKNLYLVLLVVGALLGAQTRPAHGELATDRFPSGAATPEGAACDLVRAFMQSDVELLETTCIKRYPPAQEKYARFLAMIVRGTEEDKTREAPHPKNPAEILKVFAARHLSKGGPASYGFAVLNLQDVMFVDVLARLHDGSSFVNRTLVVKTQNGLWRVHPCPMIDPLLSAGLNEESDSTVEYVPTGNTEGAPSDTTTTGGSAFAPSNMKDTEQALTVGEILNCEPERALDRLPSVVGEWNPIPPEELVTATEPELVFLQLLVHPTGKFDHCTRGTNPVLNKGAGKALKNLKLAPAQAQGQPTDAYVWLPLIFNPAAAAAGPRDAIPRVLAATPFLAPAALFAELKLGGRNKVPLRATLEISADGTLLKATLDHDDERLQTLVEQALLQWRFAPARRDGRPTAARLRLPVAFFSDRVLQRPGADNMLPDIKPKLVRSGAPQYPKELLKARVAGQVLVRLTVDTEGRVQDPKVVESSDPGFDRPALAAVRGWLFSPAQRAGKPVPLSIEVPVRFDPPQ